MALFMALCTDKPGRVALRLATREAHLAYLDSVKSCIKIGGPFLDDAGDPVGSLLVVEADSALDARAILAKDPYALAGLFGTVLIRPWRWTVGAPAA